MFKGGKKSDKRKRRGQIKGHHSFAIAGFLLNWVLCVIVFVRLTQEGALTNKQSKSCDCTSIKLHQPGGFSETREQQRRKHCI